MKKILSILRDIRPDIDFTTEDELIDGGILDSLDITAIISELNDEFDIAIRVTELDPENFNSASAIYAMCMKLRNNDSKR